MSAPPEMEYVKLWMQQSALFWSRLQSAAVLHTAVLAGWYSLEASRPKLATSLLALGLLISLFLLAIMCRDAQYMKAIQDKAGKDVFPFTGKDAPIGTWCGRIIVIILMSAEAGLVLRWLVA